MKTVIIWIELRNQGFCLMQTVSGNGYYYANMT